MQKYSVNQYSVNNILTWVQTDNIAIPEIQRPFVWNSVKVRDLMDSLYSGYPIGYLIAWKNPNIRLKDGSQSEGKRILIDGQQRVTALRAAILGEKIVDDEYQQRHINIAFNPIDEVFETLTPAIEKDVRWISRISDLLSRDGALFPAVNEYCKKNPDVPREDVELRVEKLMQIKNSQIGFIELESDLDIDVVTEIFVRINSEGVVLGQADFVMSKIAAYEYDDNFGPHLRKAIDYFSHLAKAPHFYEFIAEHDTEFAKTGYFEKMKWLKNENDSLYDPEYSDILRVAFTKEFERGRMKDLVSLLSGRNFETRDFEENIIEDSFKRLSNAVQDFINETHFKRFIMIVKSAGFIESHMINSQNVLNMAYAVYLKLRDMNMDNADIEKYVQKWLVMSILTGRYSGSPESQIDYDIKHIVEEGIEDYLAGIEEAQLSDAYWNSELVQNLDRSIITSPHLQVFFASQVKNNTLGFLSKNISVRDMIEHRGDIHHIFPKNYIKKMYPDKKDYNQVANYAYTQSEINIAIGNKAPNDYFTELLKQCDSGEQKYGNITNKSELLQNLSDHAIPHDVFNLTNKDYLHFLEERRALIANKIKEYYYSLSGINDNGSTIDHLKIIANGESDTVEFKEGLAWGRETTEGYNPEASAIKVIASFLNTNGGDLYVGVDDSGDVTGIEDDVNQNPRNNNDSYITRLDKAIQKYLGKTISQYVKIEVITLKGKSVCHINVLPSVTPVYFKDGSKKEFYIRSNGSSNPLDIEEAQQYISKHF